MIQLKTLFALIGLAGMWLAPKAASVVPDGSRLIAQSDAGKVLYRMISCEQPAEAVSDCHAREQQRLARRIQMQWINAAAKMQGVALKPDEETDVARKTAAEESHIVTAAARFKALAVAAAKIRRGEDRARVLAELSKQGITAQDLDWELGQLPTLLDAERAAAKDFVAEGRQATRDYYAGPYVIEQLREIVSLRAAAEHASFDSAEEQFWTNVAHATHTRIIDPSFSLPDQKGILISR